MGVEIIPESRVYICDRCQKRKDHKPWGSHSELKVSHQIEAYSGDIGGAHADYLLCPACQDQFFHFMAGKTITELP